MRLLFSYFGFIVFIFIFVLENIEAGGYGGYGGGYGVGYGGGASASSGAYASSGDSHEYNKPSGSILSLSGILGLGGTPFISSPHENNEPDISSRKKIQINGVPDILGGIIGVLEGSSRGKCSYGNCKERKDSTSDESGNFGPGSLIGGIISNAGSQPVFGSIYSKPGKSIYSGASSSVPDLSSPVQCKGNDCAGPSKDLLSPPFGILIPICGTGNCNPPLTNGGGCFNGNCNQNPGKSTNGFQPDGNQFQAKLPNENPGRYVSPSRPNLGNDHPKKGSSEINDNLNNHRIPYGVQSEIPTDSHGSPTSKQNNQPLQKNPDFPCQGLFCYSPDVEADSQPSSNEGRNTGNHNRPKDTFSGPQTNKGNQHFQGGVDVSINLPSGSSFGQVSQPSINSPCQGRNCYSGKPGSSSDEQNPNYGESYEVQGQCREGNCNTGSSPKRPQTSQDFQPAQGSHSQYPSKNSNSLLNGPQGNQGPQSLNSGDRPNSNNLNPQYIPPQKQSSYPSGGNSRSPSSQEPSQNSKPFARCKGNQCINESSKETLQPGSNDDTQEGSSQKYPCQGGTCSVIPSLDFNQGLNIKCQNGKCIFGNTSPTNDNQNTPCEGPLCKGGNQNQGSPDENQNSWHPVMNPNGGSNDWHPAANPQQSQCSDGNCNSYERKVVVGERPCRGPSCKGENQNQGSPNKDENSWHPVMNPNGGSNEWHPGANPQPNQCSDGNCQISDVKVVVVEYPSEGTRRTNKDSNLLSGLPFPNINVNLPNLPASLNTQTGPTKVQVTGDIIFPDTCLNGDCGHKKSTRQGGYGASSSSSWSSSFANSGSWASGTINENPSNCQNGKCGHGGNKSGASSYSFAGASASAHSY